MGRSAHVLVRRPPDTRSQVAWLAAMLAGIVLQPTIAVVEGYAVAGGFELMISCDFAIAADDAKIGDFHIRRALFGGAGPIYRLPRYIGLRKTKELLFILSLTVMRSEKAHIQSHIRVALEP